MPTLRHLLHALSGGLLARLSRARRAWGANVDASTTDPRATAPASVEPSSPIPSISSQQHAPQSEDLSLEAEEAAAAPLDGPPARATLVEDGDLRPPARANDVGVPLTQDELSRQIRLLQRRSAEETAPRQDDVPYLRTLLQHVGRPSNAPQEDAARLLEGCQADNWKRWDRMGDSGRRRWLAYLTAWMRAIDDQAGRGETGRVFALLAAYSSSRRPGTVNGLARAHSPDEGSWLAQATRLADELDPRSAESERRLKTTEPRANVVEPPHVDADVEDDGPGDDWRFWGRVAGQRAVIFGGALREERRAALETSFRLVSLDWVEAGKPRAVQSLCQRIKGGNFDFVLATRFASHKETRALQVAARAGGARFVMLRNGYGLAEVRQGFEWALRGVA